MTVIAKIGSSSLTDAEGAIRHESIAKLCAEIAAVRAAGQRCVLVSSGAIAAGLPALGLGGANRPRDPVTLQAVSAVGQSRLMQVYDDELARHGLVAWRYCWRTMKSSGASRTCPATRPWRASSSS